MQWKGEGGKRPVLEQSLAGSVLTLTKDCSGGGCGAIDLTLSVPSGVSVQARTSNGQVTVATDGRTAYYDFVTSGGGTTTVEKRAGPQIRRRDRRDHHRRRRDHQLEARHEL